MNFEGTLLSPTHTLFPAHLGNVLRLLGMWLGVVTGSVSGVPSVNDRVQGLSLWAQRHAPADGEMGQAGGGKLRVYTRV